MSNSKSRVRRVFDKVERTVGSPLERAATSYKFVDVMAMGIKTKRAVGGTAGRLIGGVLHKVNIATRDDVQRLNSHLSVLAGELRAINPAPGSPPASVAPVAKKAASKKSVSKKSVSKRSASKKSVSKTSASKTPATKSSASTSSTPRGDG